MKVETLKSTYTNPPIEFHNAVLRTLNSLPEVPVKTEKPHRIKSKPLRVAIIAAIIAASLTATAAVSAMVYNMVVTQNGRYGLNISVGDDSEKAKEPAITTKLVRFNLDYLPEGMKYDNSYTEMPELKISLRDDSGEKFIYLDLDRVEKDFDISAKYVDNYKKLDINGNEAVLLYKQYSEDSITYKEAFIYYKDSGLLVSAEFNPLFDDDEIAKILKGITLSPAEKKEDNYTIYIRSEYLKKTEPTQDEAELTPEEVKKQFKSEPILIAEYIDTPLNTEIKPNHKSYELVFNKIEVHDDINGLEKNCFNLDAIEGTQIFDSNGKMLTANVNEYVMGDGVSSIDRKIEKDAKLKLVTAEITLTNPTDSILTFYPDVLQTGITEGEHPFIDYDFDASGIIYLDDGSKEGFGNYSFVSIPANSSKKITIGVLSNEYAVDYQGFEIEKSDPQPFEQLHEYGYNGYIEFYEIRFK